MTSFSNLVQAVPIATLFVSLTICYCITWVFYARFLHPLRHIPGPFSASISRYWLVSRSMSGHVNLIQRDLHKKYGPLIRIAPDEVACADPEAIKTIYSTQKPWLKTDFYDVFTPQGFTKYLNLFTVRDEKVHAQRRRIVNQVFTLSNVLQSEACFDQCSSLFLNRLGKFAVTGESCDLGIWLLWFSFDVIGELFFGKMFGFMEHSHDHQDFIASIEKLMPIMARASVTPSYWRPFVLGSTMFSSESREAMKALDHLAQAAKTRAADRMALESSDAHDLLQQLVDIAKAKGDKMDFGLGEVQMEAWVALMAGADTTAIELRAVFHYLLTTPDVYRQLQNEIDDAARKGQLSQPILYSEAARLPFLSACIKEAMRLNPSFGYTLPRTVPPEGAQVSGMYLPGGTKVGMNATVVHFDENMFGPDADEFRPARWLEKDAITMEKHILTFGAGTRVCIGKHISLCNIQKIVPSILLRYKLELAADAKWEVENIWFYKQAGLKVNISGRSLGL